MRKIFILFILLAINTCFIYSQIGVNAGLNLSSVRSSSDAQKSWMPGFHIGTSYDVKLYRNLYLQPQVQLSYEPLKNTYDYYREEMHHHSEILEKGWYLNIPVLISYRIPLHNSHYLSLGLGGYFSVGLFGDKDMNQTIEGKYEELSGTLFSDRIRDDHGLSARISYQINRYIISTQMKYGLPGRAFFTDKTMTWMMSFGYQL